MTTSRTIKTTLSVCPVCLRRLPAEIVKAGREYFLEKTCPEHGFFSAVIWRGENPSFETWGDYTPPAESSAPDCPNSCGLCAGHLQKTCCALVEVTSRCNLNCPVCFASSGNNNSINEPTVGELFALFKRLVHNGNTFVQLSGGEPTIRDDLPEIIAAAKKAGCENIQLNTNGIRLGEDSVFTKALKDAGLSFVFMQFDGTEEAIYEKLRGQPLLEKKKAAIKACADHLIGVTLVPTIVPQVNDHNIGEIVNFGLSGSPAVRGIHFQPVSYFGRYPKAPENKDRITLPEILRAVEEQTGGKVKITDFAPSACDHPRCGFHGDFVVLPNTILRLTSKKKTDSCCHDTNAHLKNRNFVSRRWKRTDDGHAESAGSDYSDMDTFLKRVRSHGFTITAMAFQDAYTLDIERLRRCSLHVCNVHEDGRMIPFCANYITSFDQPE
jgi:7,8-dihydro-6-hydroxymethylpterin dimethyltransferase